MEKYILGIEEAKKLVSEIAREYNISVEDLLVEARDIRDSAELLDRIEAIAINWSLLDPIWGEYAKAVLLARIYREARGDWRRYKSAPLAEKKLSWYSLKLLYTRYLLRSSSNLVTETPTELFMRVAKYISSAEPSSRQRSLYGKLFYENMIQLKFLPNSPTLMNAGTRYPQLAACFVVPVGDDMDEILEATRVSAWIFKSGAGTGYDFSTLRARGSPIKGTGGASSGPLSFMRIFDTIASVVKEGGKRRAAMMAIMQDWHRDIVDFITSKCREDEPVFENFNLSVGVHDVFIERVLGDELWRLYNPLDCPWIVDSLSGDYDRVSRLCKDYGVVSARDLFDKAAYCAWLRGDPGMVFIDTINKHNPTPGYGRIHATNPCGETPLLDWEACNLGSINLAKFVRNGEVLWSELADTIKVAVRFLDDVIDVSQYPHPSIDRAVKKTRKIGLGVMGFADALAELGIPYDSDSALFFADKLMEFIAFYAWKTSAELASEKGPYPLFHRSIHAEGRFNFEPQVDPSRIYDLSLVDREVKDIVESRPSLDWEVLRKEVKRGVRNATVTTIAPTGSISIIAGVSSGIEPFFALVYIRRTGIGAWVEVNRYLLKWLRENDMLSRDILVEIASRGGGIRWAPWAPPDLKKKLPVALEIEWKWHVRMQAVFQRWVDNAVSKTVNLPSTASIGDVKNIFIEAWRLGCKGITVFRDKSREEQVIEAGEEVEKVLREPPKMPATRDKHFYRWFRIGKKELIAVHDSYSGGCPGCDT